MPAPSPLDQIDLHAIATVNILKGPAAATLYGADAANWGPCHHHETGRAGAHPVAA